MVKTKDTTPDVRSMPSLSFAVKDERTGAYYPSIAERVKVDEPIQWICDIMSQTDMLRTEHPTARITFRVISWERV